MRVWILSARLAGARAVGLFRQALAGALFGCLLPPGTAAASSDYFVYPEAAREAVTDHYFGTKVSDPYRWIEGSSGNLCVNGRPLREGMKAPTVLHRLGNVS
jgi:hypothetical protein